MQQIMTTLAVFLLAVSATAPLRAQSPEDNTERAVKALRKYISDTTELPLCVTSKITQYDARGRVKRVKSTTHTAQVVRVDRGAYSSGLRISLQRVNRAAAPEHLNTDSALLWAGLPAIADNATTYLRLAAKASSDSRVVTLTEDDRCVNDTEVCGAAQWTFDADDFEPVQYSFVAKGVTLPRFKEPARMLRLELEFAKTVIANEAKPFTVPKRVTATFEFDKRKVVVESEYTPSSINRR